MHASRCARPTNGSAERPAKLHRDLWRGSLARPGRALRAAAGADLSSFGGPSAPGPPHVPPARVSNIHAGWASPQVEGAAVLRAYEARKAPESVSTISAAVSHERISSGSSSI